MSRVDIAVLRAYGRRQFASSARDMIESACDEIVAARRVFAIQHNAALDAKPGKRAKKQPKKGSRP